MTVRVSQFEPENDIIAHAIIWRSLEYCTLVIRNSEDDFDKFKGSSFVIGNDTIFYLRVYQGHIQADVTATLYLSDEIYDEAIISEMVLRIIQEMQIPETAIAWRRGQKFQFGILERSPHDRLLEREARLLVLKIAASQKSRSISIADLRREIPKYFDLSAADRTPSPSRRNEVAWHIVLRNATSSHKDGPKTIFGQGWAKKIPGGIQVTRIGLAYLNSIGFSDFVAADFEELE
ncbi:hypothetical protein [Sediminicoccus sp. KRV36]|uniref:hypothetical protein n=1 Tax=Sediminicoccus sp. KRV36 TaxID=3133721 RepID=UPI00200C1257|nr:hypothetical protein [Sediminicoccus rosea]UPY38658.1 hypothetical protein LHU95_08165 [Sediminicoccus rosea]